MRIEGQNKPNFVGFTFADSMSEEILRMGNMQDFYNPLFIFFLIRNKLTVNLSQLFFHNVFDNIEDIVNSFPLDVYSAVFFAILFMIIACHEKIELNFSWMNLHIWMFSPQVVDNLEWV